MVLFQKLGNKNDLGVYCLRAWTIYLMAELRGTILSHAMCLRHVNAMPTT